MNIKELTKIFQLSFAFKLEVQHNIVCCFAPEGRDVYSLACFLYSEAP